MHKGHIYSIRQRRRRRRNKSVKCFYISNCTSLLQSLCREARFDFPEATSPQISSGSLIRHGSPTRARTFRTSTTNERPRRRFQPTYLVYLFPSRPCSALCVQQREAFDTFLLCFGFIANGFSLEFWTVSRTTRDISGTLRNSERHFSDYFLKFFAQNQLNNCAFK